MTISSNPRQYAGRAQGPGPDHSPGAWTMEEVTVELIDSRQAEILKALAAEAREPEAYSESLTSDSAEVRIRILRAKLHKDKSGAQHKPE